MNCSEAMNVTFNATFAYSARKPKNFNDFFRCVCSVTIDFIIVARIVQNIEHRGLQYASIVY